MLIKPTLDSSSLIDIVEEHISLASGPNSVSASRKDGVFVNGGFSISSDPTHTVWAGIYRFNEEAVTAMPSTLITPVPTFELDVPVKTVGVKTAVSAVVVSSMMGIF